jgi:hypothetical protein
MYVLLFFHDNSRKLNHVFKIFFEYRDALINAEIHILSKLGFNVHVQHPHGFMINYLQSLGLTDEKDFAQKSWNYLNDRWIYLPPFNRFHHILTNVLSNSLRTPVVCIYPPSTIACAAIFLTSRVHGVRLPPFWFELFDAQGDDLENISLHILTLYKNKLMHV